MATWALGENSSETDSTVIWRSRGSQEPWAEPGIGSTDDREVDRGAEGGEWLEEGGEALAVDRLDRRVEVERATGELGQRIDLGAVEDRDEAEEGARLAQRIGAGLASIRAASWPRAGRVPRCGFPAHPCAPRSRGEPAAKARDPRRAGTPVGDQQLVVEAVGVEVVAHRKPALPTLAVRSCSIAAAISSRSAARFWLALLLAQPAASWDSSLCS